MELRKQGVQTLHATISVVDRLLDFKYSAPSSSFDDKNKGGDEKQSKGSKKKSKERKKSMSPKLKSYKTNGKLKSIEDCFICN